MVSIHFYKYALHIAIHKCSQSIKNKLFLIKNCNGNNKYNFNLILYIKIMLGI